MNSKDENHVSYQSILEGHAPHMLYWKLEHLDPYRRPQDEDFSMINGHQVFGKADSRMVRKPFASRKSAWRQIDYENLKFTSSLEGDTDLFRWETPDGTLTARRHHNHMTEYPIKSVDDLPLWQYVHENMVYRRNPAFSEDEGRTSRTINHNWSPVQELLQFETGIENFYYFLADAPDQMEKLMETMHHRNLDSINVGLESCPNAKVLFLGENTSSQLISPDFYRKLTLPHVHTYAEIAHRHGMKFVVHMCGRLTALLDCFAETGMDGIHAVTPPTIGDSHYMAVRERFGDEFIIIGRLNAQVVMGKQKREILEILQNMIPERLIHTPFALWISTDEIQLPAEDLDAIIWALDEMNRQYASTTEL